MPPPKKRRHGDYNLDDPGTQDPQPSPANMAETATPSPSKRVKASASATAENPDIGILEGITRGSIAHIVLGRLGKLNEAELLRLPSPLPSQLSREDGESPDRDDAKPTAPAATKTGDEEKDTAASAQSPNSNDDDKQPPVDTARAAMTEHQHEILLSDTVAPQATALDQTDPKHVDVYVVHSGPFLGARGKCPKSLHVFYFRNHLSHVGHATTTHINQT